MPPKFFTPGLLILPLHCSSQPDQTPTIPPNSALSCLLPGPFSAIPNHGPALYLCHRPSQGWTAHRGSSCSLLCNLTHSASPLTLLSQLLLNPLPCTSFALFSLLSPHSHIHKMECAFLGTKRNILLSLCVPSVLFNQGVLQGVGAGRRRMSVGDG